MLRAGVKIFIIWKFVLAKNNFLMTPSLHIVKSGIYPENMHIKYHFIDLVALCIRVRMESSVN